MAYVDTDVIVAGYAPDDKMYEPAKQFLKTDGLTRIVSPLTFLELTAVLSRGQATIEGSRTGEKQSLKRRVRATIEYIFRDAKLHMFSVSTLSNIKTGSRTVSVPLEYSHASRLASILRLKTLDLMHLAYADLVKKLEQPVEYFVTGDKSILAKEGEIRDELGLSASHPTDLGKRQTRN